MMTIDIHDVGHGACAVVTCPNGVRFMFDCGFGRDANWYPSIHYAGGTMDVLAITNLDEDHVDDLPYLWEKVRVRALFTNPTLSASALVRMKAAHGMDAGVRHAHTLLTQFGPGFAGEYTVDAGGVGAWAHFNRYGLDFTDTNNLSLATFVRYGAFTMLFTGDLEKPGWRKLLERLAFRADLATVKLLMASHHGRENGCCEEAFQIMRPGAVIFSDKAKEYETQETDGWYRRANRVIGIDDYDNPLPGGCYQKRRILTTRRDGSMHIQAHTSGGYFVNTSRGTPRLLPPAPLASLFAA